MANEAFSPVPGSGDIPSRGLSCQCSVCFGRDRIMCTWIGRGRLRQHGSSTESETSSQAISDYRQRNKKRTWPMEEDSPQWMAPPCFPSPDPGISQDLLSFNHPQQAHGFPFAPLLFLSLICLDSDPLSFSCSHFSQSTFHSMAWIFFLKHKPSHATFLFYSSVLPIDLSSGYLLRHI